MRLSNLTPKGADANKLKREMHARLVAQEYVRNGMHLPKAYEKVTGFKAFHKTMKQMVRDFDAFVDEVRILLKGSSVDKDVALNYLWSVINMSILDYFDEHGNLMTVEQMKKLPRIMQQLLHKINVQTTEVEIRDKDGSVMVDDMGNPQKLLKQRVQISLPEKMEAINQLAKIMRWVGPDNGASQTINIGSLMVSVDERKKKLEDKYRQAQGEDVRALPSASDSQAQNDA